MKDTTVDVVFRYTEQDFVRGMRAHYSSRLRFRLDLVVTLLTAATGIYLWRISESRAFGMTLVGVSIFFVVMLVAAFVVIPHLAFRRQEKLHHEYALTFSPSGIHFRSVHIDSALQWSIYSRALVSPHSFLLYYGAVLFTVIPKRAFGSMEQLAIFEQLLREHVPSITTR